MISVLLTIARVALLIGVIVGVGWFLFDAAHGLTVMLSAIQGGGK